MHLPAKRLAVQIRSRFPTHFGFGIYGSLDTLLKIRTMRRLSFAWLVFFDCQHFYEV